MLAQAEAVYFHEEQTFRQGWLSALMAIVVGVEVAVTFAVWLAGNPDGALAAMMVGLLVLAGVAALLWTLKLTVRVEPGYLRVRYSPLLRKDIPLDDLRDWQVRTYRPILEYGGWGLRYSPWSGRAYNVFGNRGVQLTLDGGKRLLIGSQRPEEFAEAITRARGGGAG